MTNGILPFREIHQKWQTAFCRFMKIIKNDERHFAVYQSEREYAKIIQLMRKSRYTAH